MNTFPNKRLCLGTAQFGLNYGISNDQGQIAPDQVEKILELAHHHKIKWLDTSADYGTCEEALNAYPELIQNFKITTKSTKYSSDSNEEFASITKRYKDQLKKTCRNLHRSHADIYYLRSPEDMFYCYGKKVSDFLISLKDDGIIKKTGISIYNAQQIDDILKYFTPDVVQIPCSIFDQRLLDSGHIQKLHSMGIEIHARSIFLQGLIFIPPEQLPDFFTPISSHLRLFHNKCHKKNLTSLEAALSFVLSQDMISRIIVGVSSVQNLQEIIDAVSKVSCITNNWEDMKLDDEKYLNPANWEK